MKKKYLYCVPFEGFNDVLCQIHRSIAYSQKHNRTLVINTLHSSLDDQFSKYFTINLPNVILHPDDSLLSYFNTLTTYPQQIHGCFSLDQHNNDEGFVDKLNPYADVLSPNLPFLRVDFSKAYSEDLLLYRKRGGGRVGTECCRYLQFLPEIAETVNTSLTALGDDYDAVHIRNTDYGTDYMPFFETIKPSVCGRKLLICSDDATCRDVAFEFFTDSEVMVVTNIPKTNGRALFCYPQDAYTKNINMLTDLMALARSQHLFTATLSFFSKELYHFNSNNLSELNLRNRTEKRMFTVPTFSGFSRLAHLLQMNQHVVDGLFIALHSNLYVSNIPTPGENISACKKYVKKNQKEFIKYVERVIGRDIELSVDAQKVHAIQEIFDAVLPMNPLGSQKTRIGHNFTGSCVMLDPGCNGIAYRLGDSHSSPWDRDLVEKGFKVYQYGCSLDPEEKKLLFFHFNNRLSSTIFQDILKQNGHEEEKNLILYLDIKGAEWDFLKNLPEKNLSSFQQIFVKFHAMRKLNPMKYAVLNKLRQTHTPIHIHYVNAAKGQLLTFFEKIDFIYSGQIEISFARTGDYKFTPSHDYFPTPLDRPSTFFLPDIPIGYPNLLRKNLS